MNDLDVKNAAGAYLRLFMLEQRLWPDEMQACEKVLEILERYKR